MVPPSDAAPLSAQLAALCAEYPHAPKIVFVPRVQLGRALEEAVARRQGGWAGLVCLLPRHYAEQLAGPEAHRSGRAELPVGGRAFLVARILQALGREESFEDLPAPHRFVSAAAEAIETLRLGAVAPDALRARAGAAGAPETLRALAACYERYLDLLARHALYDDADVFAWAMARVEAGRAPGVEKSVIAVCNEVELPERAYRFLEALRAQSRAFYRLGSARPGAPPPHTAAALFWSVEPPVARRTRSGAGDGVDGRREAEPTPRFGRAVGAASEVEAMFRDVLARGGPLDEVEIAYTDPNPYLSLIADRADRLDLPVSIGTGLPAGLTRTGQALRAFYEWIVEDFDARILIRVLRSGHLRVDRLATGDGVSVEAHELATLLAARRYEPGREGLRKGIGGAIRENEERIRELEERDLEAVAERQALARLYRLRTVVDALLGLAPRAASVRAMAEASKQFVERFGPVDKPADDLPEEARTLEEAARMVLVQKLDALARLPFTYEASAVRLAALFRSWLEAQYVRAEHPRPGAAHVLPLESAGYGGRAHLYVVGLDSETLATAATEDAMLRDRDRRALSASLDGVLPERGAAADEALWRAAQALGRHAGTLSLYTRIFDVESGEERHPSPLFLQLEARHGTLEDGRVAGFVPGPERGCVLSDAEAWLAAYRARGAASDPPTETARGALHAAYPWLSDGEAARRARASEVYTEHDGLLAEGTYPELDFLGGAYDGALSAARLETLAETPYLYFLRYVLGVRPLDEPALDEEPWFNRRRRGTLLHATFESFMRRLDGEPPSLEHEPLLREVLRAELEREIERVVPPSRVEEEAARRQLLEDARLFLRVEAERAAECTPLYHEVGFGFGPYRRREGDLGEVALPVGDAALPLRGVIDRVDRRPDGSLAVWDYKTGSSASFDEADPVQNGATLQWALYAYALEAATGKPVASSGYYFTSIAEMGVRLAFEPSAYRPDVEALIRRLARLARSGSFPMNPKAKDIGRWQWGGYDRLFPDLAARSKELAVKAYPEGRPRPPWLD